ncbi:hypothetical protein NDU88_012681 [Pleurodeles waltl]|uniref:Uncharacterized protein n=1 Tax=Pleurodeles waltl TaxID=8319 RepID=A0AAV7R5B1_PLEWA|nr:hypothetical protein NDU88_012681 [Pleurodeles waltl]
MRQSMEREQKMGTSQNGHDIEERSEKEYTRKRKEARTTGREQLIKPRVGNPPAVLHSRPAGRPAVRFLAQRACFGTPVSPQHPFLARQQGRAAKGRAPDLTVGVVCSVLASRVAPATHI